mgnify:CR=1 FL=1
MSRPPAGYPCPVCGTRLRGPGWWALLRGLPAHWRCPARECQRVWFWCPRLARPHCPGPHPPDWDGCGGCERWHRCPVSPSDGG